VLISGHCFYFTLKILLIQLISVFTFLETGVKLYGARGRIIPHGAFLQDYLEKMSPPLKVIRGVQCQVKQETESNSIIKGGDNNYKYYYGFSSY